jgi:branched-chain amino acid transport system permease protein
LDDHYLTLATLAVSEILTNIFRGATELTGGANGLAGVAPLAFNGIALLSPQDYFPVCAITAGVALLAAWTLQRSFLGKALKAAGDSGVYVETLGISSDDLRLAGFVIGGCFAGLAGALAAHIDGFVGPESFGVDRSVAYLCFLVIGGLGSLRSVVVGAAFAVVVSEVLRGMVGWQMVILASAALATLYVRSLSTPAILVRVKRRFGGKEGAL